MAVTKAQKAEQLVELQEKFQKAQSVLFTHYIGLTVTEASDLRKQLRAAGAEMKVAKKTLLRLAAENQKLPTMEESELSGPVAAIFSYNDPLSGAQVAFKYGKDHPQIAFIGALFEGKVLNKAEAKNLATIPTRPILLATFAMMIRSPLVKFATICNTPLGSFARAIKQMEEKGGFGKVAAPSQESAAPAAEAPVAEAPAAA
jgi:large subunit ribosomal protein L10